MSRHSCRVTTNGAAWGSKCRPPGILYGNGGTSPANEEAPVERDELVAALNADLESEYRSIVQYVQHVAIIKGAKYLATIAELRQHLIQELSHAQTLAEQIDFLGGIPTTKVGHVTEATEADVALKADLALEREQLDRYRERFAQAEGMGLADVAEALRPLLTQTQEHVRELETILG